MESKFIPTLQLGNGYTHLKLRGILDEDNVLTTLLSQIQGRLLLIDLAEIERINSCGVRDWVNWLNQIQALGIQVILLRCSPSAISQANMVANFAADAFIHSFYAPYVHPETGEEQSVLLFTEELRQMKTISAPKIYNDSGEELEFDEFEESYFAFIYDPRMMQYEIAKDIQSVIQYFVPEAVNHQPVIAPKTSTSILASAASHAMANRPSSSNFSQINRGPNFRGPNFGAAQSHSAPMASAPSATPTPYSGQTSAAYHSQNAMPAATQSTSIPAHMSPYGAPARAARPIPTPAQPIRHEQPPIPNPNQYQSLSSPKLQVQNSAPAQRAVPPPATAPPSAPPRAIPSPEAGLRQGAATPNIAQINQEQAYLMGRNNDGATQAPSGQRRIQTVQGFSPLKKVGRNSQLNMKHKILLAVMSSIALILIIVFIILLILR